jgi:ABC-type antimicrobial peptide transport system permease subunit
MALLAGLAFSAAVLAAIGVYGVVTYSVTRRTGEIGIRMALGADARLTFSDVVIGALRRVAAGVAIGLAGAALLGQWVQSLLFGVSPLDVITYLIAGVSLMALGAAAAAIPALRAARIDPVTAIRER